MKHRDLTGAVPKRRITVFFKKTHRRRNAGCRQRAADGENEEKKKMEKPVLKNMTIDEMKIFFTEIGEKPFRGQQVFEWIYKGADSFEAMRNLPKALQAKLAQMTEFQNIRTVTVQQSKTDGTENTCLKCLTAKK